MKLVVGNCLDSVGLSTRTNTPHGGSASHLRMRANGFELTATRVLWNGSCRYRVWGNVPWSGGDFLTHGVLNRLYPGYEQASYFHNEAGFLTATPHGDTADVLLSDAPRS